MKLTRGWVIIIGLVALVAVGAGGFLWVRYRQQAAAPKLETGEVTQITAVTSVSA